jgi:hypothetical protein
MQTLKHLHGVSAGVVVGLAGLSSTMTTPAVWGQADSAPKAATSGADAPVQKAPPCMALDFPGGTAKGYYDALKKAWPKAEFMLHPDLERIAMPAVKFDCIEPAIAATMPQDILTGIQCTLGPVARGGDDGAFYVAVRVNQKAVTDWIGPKPTAIDLVFAGGGIEELVNAVKKASPRPVNVSISSDAKRAIIPALSFKGAEVFTIFEAACRASSDVGFALSVTGNDALWHIVAVEPLQAPANPSLSRVNTRSQAFPINPLVTDKQSLDDVMAAIQTMMDLSGEKVVMKFHKETGMLMVRATEERMLELHNLLSELRDNAGVPQDQSWSSRLQALEMKMYNVHNDVALRLRDMQSLVGKETSGTPKAAPIARPVAPTQPSPPSTQPEEEKPN